MRGILNWFAGADNCLRVVKVIESIIRYSCWLTLKKKFKLKNISTARDDYTKNLAVGIKEKYVSQLITRKDILKKFGAYQIDKNLTVNFVQEYFDKAKVVF